MMGMPIAWLIYAMVGGVFLSPIASLTRGRIQWRGWVSLALIFPFLVWARFWSSGASIGLKTLSNLVFEPAMLGVALAAAALLRAWIGAKASERASFAISLAALCGVAIVVSRCVPPLTD